MLTEEDEDKIKDVKASLTNTDSKKSQKKIMKSQPKSAFLGPQIWKKPITLNQLAGNDDDDDVEGGGDMDVSGAKFSVMNVDEFLAENDLISATSLLILRR